MFESFSPSEREILADLAGDFEEMLRHALVERAGARRAAPDELPGLGWEPPLTSPRGSVLRRGSAPRLVLVHDAMVRSRPRRA
jgi:hypothetical protein